MSRSIKIVKSNPIPKDIEGCLLIPLDKAKPSFPKIQSNVLETTYYRVRESDQENVIAMLTVMPDDGRVGWDRCGKCLEHIRLCNCATGIYHPQSIGWIRATYDINYPTERVKDYSNYYDPYMRLTDTPIPIRLMGNSPSTPQKNKSNPVAKKKAVEISVSEIENIDFAELGKQATKQAKTNVRRARSIIRGAKR